MEVIKENAEQSGVAEAETEVVSDFYASFNGIVSSCPQMHKVFRCVEKVAQTNSTVLILGESGTGKELIARALHKLSGRKGKLIPVNCGAIPEEILESELFGHERGAFTGAVSSRQGRFQLAHGGTIFLDEIGEMSPKLQVKLLRVLQERKVDPVGATRSLEVDVRVVAATHKNLAEATRNGEFREDLFYRLSVVPVELPPLRARSKDKDLLANYFLSKSCRQLNRETPNFSEEALAVLQSYRWPGNVRELENLMERLAILTEGTMIGVSDLPEYIRAGEGSVASHSVPRFIDVPEEGLDFNQAIDMLETSLIQQALDRVDWNKKAAADLLGLNRTTLVEKIRKKGLTRTIL